jgi:hypothetical protein
MTPSKECVTCDNLNSMNVSEGVNVYPCTICCRIGMSEDIDKWKPIETKKMKSTSKRIIEALKEMFTFSDNNIVYGIRICNIILISAANYQAISARDWQFMIVLNTLYVGLFTLGYFSRKPDPNRKTFTMWVKIIALKVKIGILKKNLKPFGDLRKYSHRSESHIREMIKEWRLELKKLKRELKELK